MILEESKFVTNGKIFGLDGNRENFGNMNPKYSKAESNGSETIKNQTNTPTKKPTKRPTSLQKKPCLYEFETILV